MRCTGLTVNTAAGHGDLCWRSQSGVLPEPVAPTSAVTVERGVAVFLVAYAAA